MAQAAAIPVAQKSAREKDKERRKGLEDRRGAKAAAVPGKAKAAKAPKTVRACRCGCGEETMGYFAPGHDARWKGWVKKLISGDLKPEDLNKQQKASIGDLKKAGKGFAPVLNYDGSKYVVAQ